MRAGKAQDVSTWRLHAKGGSSVFRGTQVWQGLCVTRGAKHCKHLTFKTVSTFGPTKVGCTCPSWLICSRARWWAGPWAVALTRTGLGCAADGAATSHRAFRSGLHFTGHERQSFLRDHNQVSSRTRRGNCHENAVAESFFQLLKHERIRRQIHANRNDARADVFNYIEMFYNPKRHHGNASGALPVEFGRGHSPRLTGV